MLFKIINNDYRKLKYCIIIIVIIFSLAAELINHLFLEKPFYSSLFDFCVTVSVTFFLIFLVFSIIDKKEKQLKIQIDQLTDSYQYIGKINRKIDSLLELDLANLDHSKKDHSLDESTRKIFTQLLVSLNAVSGLLLIDYPLNLHIYQHYNTPHNFKLILERAAKNKPSTFYNSQNEADRQYFLQQGFEPEFFNKFILVYKPVYMHDKDIGAITLLFNKNSDLEERDLNIIRVYSFYLALNLTFKPDFMVKKVWFSSNIMLIWIWLAYGKFLN